MISGPLRGLKVIEFVGIGPGPHCAMMFSDMGASVLRINRAGGNGWDNPVVDRGRSTLEIDIRTVIGRDYCLDVAGLADVIIEGFRPGVMERLGLGPDVLLARNPRLIYGRITGWGQTGPLAKSAGHDINYIAVTGALAAMGLKGAPATPPLNLVGDFGGGSMFLAFGILAALLERERSGRGQVVDAAIVDGVTSLMTMFSGLLPIGRVSMERDRNILGGAAPFYRCYICADGKEIALGALEPQFYAQLMKLMGSPFANEAQPDMTDWPSVSAKLAQIFKERTSDEWCELLEGTDACFAPVVPLKDAPDHPHLAARHCYEVHSSLRQASPAPRFSRTPGAVQDCCPSAADLVDTWRAERASI